jgi:Flp pilus assembly protein TadD
MADGSSPMTLGDPRTIEDEIVAFGQALLKEGQVNEAVRFFKQTARLLPESPAISACLGEAYLAKGDSEKARASFARARQLVPENDGIRNEVRNSGGAK